MYIPRGVSEADSLTPAHAVSHSDGQNSISHEFGIADKAAFLVPALVKRQFSSDPVQNTNASIGLAVGVVLGIFLIGTFAFLWVYRYSIRCSPRKKRRPSSRKGSKSSKASSDSGGEPAPEEAPAAEEAEAAPAEA